MDTLWLSHTSCLADMQDDGGAQEEWGTLFGFQTCMVSVALQDEARHRFSAIRLLIVSQKTESLVDVEFTDRSDIMKHLLFRYAEESSTRTSFRSAHIRRRSRQQRSEFLLAASPPRLPICTIVLEIFHERLESEWQSDTNFVTLRPSRLSFTELLHLHIAFDQVQEISPSNPSFLLLLGCTKLVLGIPCARGDSPIIPFHSIGVAPLNLIRRPYALLLPNEVVCHIVRNALYATNPNDNQPDLVRNWRASLVSYGLVCKSWVHVLDLFFEVLHEQRDEIDLPNLSNVVRFLEARPERGTLIRAISCSDFGLSFSAPNEHWYQFLRVLEHATSVSSLSISFMPSHAKTTMARIFQTLLRVRDCSLMASWIINGTYAKGPPYLSMGEFQTYIAEWQYLEKLCLYNWGIVDMEYASAESHTINSSTNVWRNLRKLVLVDGLCAGPELMRFASPCFTSLKLTDVKGISNHSFSTFLSVVASTITSISVIRCPMPKAENEEYALDAAMPRLTVLTSLYVKGLKISALALSRKPSINFKVNNFGEVERIYNHVSISEHYPHNVAKKFSSDEEEEVIASLTNGPAVLDEAAEALSVTGWTEATFTWRNIKLDQDTISGDSDILLASAHNKRMIYQTLSSWAHNPKLKSWLE